MFRIETDDNKVLGEFATLALAQAQARAVKLTGYIFDAHDEYWRYYNGRCSDALRGRENRKEQRG